MSGISSMDKTKNRLRKKLSLFIICALILYSVIAIFAYISLSAFFELDTGEIMYNKVRVLVNGTILNIENNYTEVINDTENNEWKEAILAELETLNGELELLGLDGKVLLHFENGIIYYNNIIRDIKTYIHYDSSYSIENERHLKFTFPIVHDGQQKLIAVFQLPKELFFEDQKNAEFINMTISIFIVFVVSFLIMLFFLMKIRKGVLDPLNKLSLSVKEISQGNLDHAVSISPKNEVEEFFRDFDLMRQELKDAKARQKELEFANKELIASISHELKTPVTCIKANIEGILGGIVKNEEMMNRYLIGIKDRTDSLAKLIDDLLSHSMQQLQKLRIEKKECYSKKLFEKINTTVESKLKPMRIRFQVLGEVPDVLVNIDELRIEQVILNLIENAGKYSSQDALITIRYSLDDKNIWIAVTDNGCGITPEELTYIFDKFYRSEKVKGIAQGSGLGLSICKYIIEQHGGIIKANSTENVGSEFIFSIPLV